MSDTEKKFPGKHEAMEENVHRETVYHYSREHRLSGASPNVQKLNDGIPIKSSFTKALFATRAHKLIFIAIILGSVTFGLTNRFSGGETGIKLGRNTVALTVVSVEETPVLGIVKEVPSSGEFYTGAVDIAVSPVLPKPKEGEEREETPVFAHRIFFNPVESEIFHLSLPFGGTDFLVVFRTGDEQKSLRFKVKKK